MRNEYGEEIKKEQNIVLEWGDVKRKFIQVVERGEEWGNGPNSSHSHYRDRLKNMAANPYDKGYEVSWEGGNGADTLKNLREGFHTKQFEHSAEYVPMGEKIRPTWNEEDGDVDPGRLVGGYDEFYLGQEERPHRPGLRLQIEFAFAAGCPNDTIAEYGAWCAGLIGSLESQGYDLTVDLWIYLDDLFQGQDRGIRSSVLMRVKRENEVSDFTEWSALFGPTGYRHLGFTAKLVAGDKIGKKADGCLGMTIAGRGWDIEYDRDRAVVKVRANQRAYQNETFPREHLNNRAREEGLIP